MTTAPDPKETLATRLQAAVQARGQRWTEQRQLIADVLAAVHAAITMTGHVLDVVQPGHAQTAPAEAQETREEDAP